MKREEGSSDDDGTDVLAAGETLPPIEGVVGTVGVAVEQEEGGDDDGGAKAALENALQALRRAQKLQVAMWRGDEEEDEEEEVVAGQVSANTVRIKREASDGDGAALRNVKARRRRFPSPSTHDSASQDHLPTRRENKRDHRRGPVGDGDRSTGGGGSNNLDRSRVLAEDAENEVAAAVAWLEGAFQDSALRAIVDSSVPSLQATLDRAARESRVRRRAQATNLVRDWKLLVGVAEGMFVDGTLSGVEVVELVSSWVGNQRRWREIEEEADAGLRMALVNADAEVRDFPPEALDRFEASCRYFEPLRQLFRAGHVVEDELEGMYYPISSHCCLSM